MSVIEMRDISVEYPGVTALSHVDFWAKTGMVHALVGANGAGKSTLMGVLSGANGAYTGAVSIDGAAAEIRMPADARRHGIATVFQEVDTVLVPELSVAENIMLDVLAEKGQRQFVNWRSLFTEANTVLERLHISLPLHERASELSLAQKQMVLIARTIAGRCRFLVLDEPTAPLSVAETERLFEVIGDLRRHDVGIVFISHRLPELFQVCDDITVLRDGQLVCRKAVSETGQDELVSLMLGRPADMVYRRKDKHAPGAPALELSHISDGGKLRDVSLHICGGEIVGVTGLVGAGKSELCGAVFGAKKAQGNLRIHGEAVRLHSPADAVRRGLALIPEERRKEGVLAQRSVRENLTVTRIGQLCRFGFLLDFPKLKKAAADMVRQLGIRTPGLGQIVARLSGGNQQKVAVGKWLATNASVFLFDEPTKGIDIGAKQDMFAIVERLASEGKAVLYASCELSEILSVTDRVYVLYGGRVVKELETAETSEEELLFYATGGK